MFTTTKNNLRKTSGFSLIEMLIYVSLLVVILTAVIGIAFSFTKSYEQLGALRAAEHTGLAAMERMVRDIHLGTNIETGESTLGMSPGVLVVTQGTTTTKFYTNNGQVRVDVNGVYIGPLSVTVGKVTNLVFRHIITENSQAIRIEMTVEGVRGSVTKIKNFYTTAILKNS